MWRCVICSFFNGIFYWNSQEYVPLSHCLKYTLFISQFSRTIVFQFLLDIVVVPRDMAAINMQNFKW